MSSHEYNQLLKFLYFEGYADSYAEAEELLESMSDEEFEDLFEVKVTRAPRRQLAQLEKNPRPRLTPSQRRSAENIRRMLGGDYSVPPGGSARSRSAKNAEPEPQDQPKPRKRTTKLSNVRMGEEFDAIEEAKDIPQEVALKLADMLKGSPQLSKRGEMARGLRLYAIGRNKKRLEKLQQNEEFEDLTERMRGDEGSEDRNSAQIRRDNEYFNKIAAKKAAQERLSKQGLKRKDGTPVFEEVIEYLFVEGFADTIENAELMAENISEGWVNEIMEAYVDLDTKKGEMRRRANRTLFVKGDWERANKIEKARETHDPAKVQAKAAANRKKGSVTEENYETKVQPPREPLKTDRNMFSISQKEKDAARERTLAKAKAIRAKKGL
jgi:hypothetical protein